MLLGMAPWACPLQVLQVMGASTDVVWAWYRITLDHGSVASALSQPDLIQFSEEWE